jgi:hypothetical protein
LTSRVRNELTLAQEAAESKIDLPDDEPEIVEYMLRYMYERDYRMPSEDILGPHLILIEHADKT